jgi:hypothetical protein
MLTASSLFLLGRLGIPLEASYDLESASLETSGLSAYFLPVIENESPEKRNARGYEDRIESMNSPYFPEEFMSPELGYSENKTVIFGPVGNSMHGFAIVPGKKWHVVLVSEDINHTDDQLKESRKNLKKGLLSTEKILPRKGFSLGETAIIPLGIANDDYCASGLKVKLPSGVIYVKFRTLKKNIKPLASDIPKLKRDLKQSLLSFSGFMKVLFFKSISSDAVSYQGLVGLENVTFVRLGDGSGQGFIMGFYQMKGAEKDSADIEMRMEFDRDKYIKAHAEFKKFVSGIESLGI